MKEIDVANHWTIDASAELTNQLDCEKTSRTCWNINESKCYKTYSQADIVDISSDIYNSFCNDYNSNSDILYKYLDDKCYFSNQ